MTVTDWGRFFDEYAPSYEAHAFGGAGLAEVSDRELRALRAALATATPGHALDIGAGTGRITRVLQECGWRVTAADASTEMLRTVTTKRCVPGVYARLGEQPLPFAGASFDAVVSLRVLKYVHAIDDAFGEIARVLKPGGLAVLEIANRNSLARFGYADAPVRLLGLREADARLRAAGIEPHGRVAGTRLPHPMWVRAHSRRAGQLASATDRALGTLLGGAERAIGARSVIVHGLRR